MSLISPTGSGSAATCSSPCAMLSMPLAVSVRRSSMRRVEAVGAGLRQIATVGLEQRRSASAYGRRHGQERPVFRRGRRRRRQPRGRRGLPVRPSPCIRHHSFRSLTSVGRKSEAPSAIPTLCACGTGALSARAQPQRQLQKFIPQVALLQALDHAVYLRRMQKRGLSSTALQPLHRRAIAARQRGWNGCAGRRRRRRGWPRRPSPRTTAPGCALHWPWPQHQRRCRVLAAQAVEQAGAAGGIAGQTGRRAGPRRRSGPRAARRLRSGRATTRPPDRAGRASAVPGGRRAGCLRRGRR